jgi:hypothetical protein
VGPRTGLDAVAKRKIKSHYTCRELNPGRPARSIVTVLTELVCAWVHEKTDEL